MEIEAVVNNGQLVLDVASNYPDGTKVRVTVSDSEGQPAYGWMKKYFGKAHGLSSGKEKCQINNPE